MGNGKMGDRTGETKGSTETGEAGVKMVALWILVTITLFIITRRRGTSSST